MSGTTPTPTRSSRVAKQAAGLGEWADQRYRLASAARRQMNKVFPTHWSFLLGEIALYTFILLLLSGTYLTLFFDPSMQEVTYHGSFQNLQNVQMSRAYASTLDISFDVRGGLFVRQVHHWAALIFIGAMMTHMFRIFFTGAFRRPRETNWVIGATLLIISLFEGFFGYSLPDDLLSGTGIRATLSGIVLSIPLIGTWVHWALFGGLFPGTLIVPRMYALHILLLPGIILGLISVHLALVWYQKHTQFPGVRRTERNVVGIRIMPLFAVKGSAWFAVITGLILIMAGVFQINPIWNYGPYFPSMVSAGSQPDWYLAWSDGLLRIWPPWELYLHLGWLGLGTYTVPAAFFPAVGGMTFVFTLTILYPWIERKLSGDTAHHNLLQRPRDVPVRTSLGVMAITFWSVAELSGFNDIIADQFNISLNAMTWIGRIGALVAPPIAYWVSYRVCIGLQRADRAVLEHGIETGIIKRLPHGEFIEVHQPLGPVDDHGHPVPLPYQGSTVPKKMNKLGLSGHAVAGTLFRPDPAEETAALERARAAADEEARAREEDREPSPAAGD